MSESYVRAAASAAFPDRTIEAARPQGGWVTNETAAVEFEHGGLVYVKVATDGDAERVPRGAAAGRFASENSDVVVAERLASGTSDGDE